MKLYRWIFSRGIYPAYHATIRSGAVARIRDLNRHDELSRSELKQIETMKLNALLAHAKSSVPYYRDVIGDAAVVGETSVIEPALQTVPILTKDIIRREQKRLVSESLEGNRLDPNSTSGSTGSPLNFFTDTRSKTCRKAVVVRNRKWLGIQNGDSVARLWGSAIDEKRAQSVRGRFHSRVTRELFLSAYQLDDAHLASYARRINKFKAKLLIGYPSVLCEFGNFCRMNSIEFPSLKAIICSAEVLYPHQRELIEDDLSTPVYDRYGCREVGDIAQEVPWIDGLVVNSDRVHVEIIGRSGEPCKPGEIGDIVITDLDNYGMPLIRYLIGDRGSWSSQAVNQQEMPYPVLSNVEGRSMDVVVCPSGNRVGGTFWTILFRKRPGIEKFRVVQHSLQSIRIDYMRLHEVPVIDTAYFREKIAETCGPEMDVEFREVNEIGVSSGEKFRLVVSEIGKRSPESSIDARSLL